jgi:group II intron reverse transcriptase/maturase
MLSAQKYIEIVRNRGERQLPLNRVYRMIRHRDLFLAAYGKLYANKGATTPGVNPEDTVDGMSLQRIDRIIGRLETGTYQWTPVKRVYIGKKRGGKRPLGLPGWNDKLVQEVIRTILEAYYEPQFANSSHGFRPGRGCHTALETIRRTWKGTKWFIEGDIEGCFDNIDHDLLLDTIGRDIHDKRFLKLLRGMLKAGYMEDWHHHQTYSGTVQGGVISPILANLVLNELDQYVEKELIPQYTRRQRRRRNPKWRRLSRQMAKARQDGDIGRYRYLERQRRSVPSKDPHDDSHRRLKYCRYADDFILSFTGPRSEAEEIKAKIGAFLKSIKLPLSKEKTLITHATQNKARFLGYEIYVTRSDNRLTKYQRGNKMLKSRTINGNIMLNVPRDATGKWCVRYTRNGKSIHRSTLLNSSDYEIVMTFNVEFQGLLNYYSLAHNVAKRLSLVRYLCLKSLVKTLAAKHKQSSTWVYCRYTRQLENGRKVIAVNVPRDPPKKPLVSIFGAHSLVRDPSVVISDDVPYTFLHRSELVSRLLKDECELCGSIEGVQVHHVRKLADVREKYRGRKPPLWATFMMGRRRKTVVVCQSCHRSIHAGTYDGPKLN